MKDDEMTGSGWNCGQSPPESETPEFKLPTKKFNEKTNPSNDRVGRVRGPSNPRPSYTKNQNISPGDVLLQSY